jgi:ribose-phosphate pyrophosphokinase
MSHVAAVLALPGAEDLADAIAARLDTRRPSLVYRRFPDGESYLRIDEDLAGAAAVLVARLDRPDEKIPALLFAADLLRDLGAAPIGLVVPYLPYMRQDKRFRPGEALTSRTFAGWLSRHFDWLATVDPHLHRYISLDDLYALSTTVVAAAPALADWIAGAVDDAVLIGPDAESEQWVSAVATRRDMPWRVLSKRRHGDREVDIELPDLSGLAQRTPVLVDDIISSGATMARASRKLIEAGFAAPLAVGVHGLFDERARAVLTEAGVARVVCTNSVAVDEGVIDLAPALAAAIEDWSIDGRD